MFNVSVKGNVRCNGIVEACRGGMVRRNVHVNSNIGAMPPSGGTHAVTDTKLKFSERLKAYLSADRTRSDPDPEADDPYQFSDGDNISRGGNRAQTVQTPVVNGEAAASRLHQGQQGTRSRFNDTKDTKHSIIGIKNEQTVVERPSGKPVPGVLRVRRHVSRGTHHEGSVQRIRSREPDKEPTEQTGPIPRGPIYQRHWFSRELELLSEVHGGREARLETMRCELRRQLHQMRRGQEKIRGTNSELLQAARRQQSTQRSANDAPPARPCAQCRRPALPCTAHCALHIMSSQDQVLFDYCTAKFADNTQCSVPVIDVAHELPLCAEHARKRDNYNKMCAEVRPKKQRRKIKPSAMIRPQRRSKKRKRPPPEKVTVIPQESTIPEEQTSLPPPAPVIPDDLELVTVEHALVTQASRLLEETDFTTVLNQIPADEFNDLFSDRNGEYEPSMEETEELERALRAVDNDVKSLEKLSQTHGLLDQLLADDSLAADLPDVVFHTAYVTPTPQ